MRFFTLLLLFATTSLFAQDTLSVQGFNFESTTRDSMISFPEGDHNGYEKILMYYTMRCKDGLVSTGSDRNRGCGEWDYSCNTSIIDSTLVDSLLLLHPSVIVQGWPATELFPFVSSPTYSYYQRELLNTKVTTTTDLKSIETGTEMTLNDHLFGNQKQNKYLIWISQDELNSLGSNKINALKLKDVSDAESIDFLNIQVISTTSNDFSYSTFLASSPIEVFNDNVNATDLASGQLTFNKDFEFVAGENIIIELSYTTNSKSKTTTLSSTDNMVMSSLYHEGQDQYAWFAPNTIEIDNGDYTSINNEISIAFWAYGNNALPANTSSIHGIDAGGNRQINIHLPWSNSRIYWDCGAAGAAYDRIDKAATTEEIKGKWNHWVFTKNATSGNMSIYLNGELWHSAVGKTNPISLKGIVIGSNEAGGNPYLGGLDDIMVFNKELTLASIKNIMNQRVTANHPDYASMVLHYDFNYLNDTNIIDHSNKSNNGNFASKPVSRVLRGQEMFKDFTSSTMRINAEIISATFNKTVTSSTILDSIQNLPYGVTPYHIEGTNLIKDQTECLWLAGEMPVYNTLGMQISTVTIPEEGFIFGEELEYYSKRPAKFELLSFVTPYGINLNFGDGGKTWIFDVTDFGPILKGKKRLLMDRGGQWQEDMDIQFKFIKGTPTRNVKSIQQIWPVDAVNYTNIQNNTRFEPRFIPVESDLGSAKLRLAITGHGQEGEFISRNHWVNINSGSNRIEWSVWKECGFNPIYPQGGTWVYDRAGWCPGAPTDIQEHEIIETIKGKSEMKIDYGINSGSGDSRYIVNTQLVKYGLMNFKNDVAIQQIKSPSSYVEFARINPVCSNPIIIVKNNGSEPITSFLVEYGVEGTSSQFYTHNETIAPLESKEVVLPSFAEGRWLRGDTFFARVSEPNGSADEYPFNDKMKSTFSVVPHLDNSIIIRVTTNGAPHENKWYVRDENGQTIFSKTSQINAFTTYDDTLSNLDGCYTFQVTDSDNDGISWWANNDGTGNVRIRSINEPWVVLQPDFGGEISYSFTAGTLTSTNDQNYSETKVVVYPNPSIGTFTFELEGIQEAELVVYDQIGKAIKSEKRIALNESYDEISVDLSDFKTGIYYAVINSDKGRIIKKLIKI